MVIKKHIGLFGSLLLLAFSLNAQTDTSFLPKTPADTVLQRIVLIGDAGLLSKGRHPVVSAVRSLVTLDNKTTVFYLGDNLYKTGLPDSQSVNYRDMKAILDSQIAVVEGNKARAIFVPGNHDWHNGSRNGFDAVMREQLYINFMSSASKVEFQPEEGCPGPVEISLGNEVTVIVFDSQWWLHPHDKPGIESDCSSKTTDELVNQIEEIASRNSKKLVLLASHHPFKSNGSHGGFFTLKQHIFPLTDLKKNLFIPLPIIGSIYPIARSVFGTPQDLKHPVYQEMINQISQKLKDIPNLVFAAGHDHNLQHIVDSNRHYLVSGGGCKTNRSSKAKNSLYNNTNMGFAVMEVSVNKNVTLDFYEVTDTSASKDYSAFLLNFTTIPKEQLDSSNVVVDDPFAKFKDSIEVAASNQFPSISGIRKFFMGKNYRKEWSTKVNMPVFNLTKRGFRILGMGGGTQTKSLQLIDNKGKEWVLRSLNRDPARVIPESFRGSLATELKSASHPYGALPFPVLAEAIDLNVASPELVFVPDDPALGFHRPLFKDNVCMLEQKHATWDGSDSRTTARLIDKMLDENDHRPTSGMILQSRFLDILTADFDRHLNQWRWGSIDTGKGKIYYPIPRDRDQAFFNSDGFALRLMSSRSMPFLQGFREKISNVKALGYIARDFDRIFMTDLDQAAWKEKVLDFQYRITDSVIRKAVQQLPPEIVAIDGETMVRKLISRRNQMESAALKYYRFLSKKVNVMGSNQKEVFRVNNTEDGGLHVIVYARSRGNDTSFIMFDRVFRPSETREVHLYGLNDDDYFDIEESASSRIKLRIIGGRGNDTFDIRGNIESLLYDIDVEKNVIKNSNKAKIRFERDPFVNERTIMGYQYNVSRFPRFHINSNSDDGLMLGAGFSRRTYGFRSLPYASDQYLQLLYALDRKAFQLRYQGVFNHVTRNMDILGNATIAQPELRNFTGFGNDTKLEPGTNTNYYLARYRYTELNIMFRKRYFETLHLMIGPYFFNYNMRYADNNNKAIGRPGLVGLDSANIFRRKNYGGGKLALLLDNRNKEFFPTRGVHWLTEVSGLMGLTPGSRNLIKYTTDMILYVSMRQAAKTVAILKWGGGRIYSKNFEFFQSMSLGGNNVLNGFRKNRHHGRALFYGGLEVKFKLLDINSFIIPGPFGVSTFIESGRVWMKDEKIGKWHAAYGAGIYYHPYNVMSLNASIGFSGGEKMVIFNLGTKFNLIW